MIRKSKLQNESIKTENALEKVTQTQCTVTMMNNRLYTKKISKFPKLYENQMRAKRARVPLYIEIENFFISVHSKNQDFCS